MEDVSDLLGLDRVQSSIRPLCAAFSSSAGRYGDQQTGSKSTLRGHSHSLKGSNWFSRSRSIRSFAHSSHRLLTPPVCRHQTSPCDVSITPQPFVPGPENPLVSSARPIFAAPSCLPAQSQPASSACVPATEPANCPERYPGGPSGLVGSSRP